MVMGTLLTQMLVDTARVLFYIPCQDIVGIFLFVSMIYGCFKP